MSWWGKIIGGSFGFMLGGPLGAVFGAAIGHNLDRGMGQMGEAGFSPGGQERVQGAFFTATFSVMGYIAKSDGHVSKDEIETASALMRQLNLSPDMMATARSLFREGRNPDFPLDDVLIQFRKECHRRQTLMRMFLEMQIHAAFADGVLHPAEKKALQHICDVLGFSQHEFDHLVELVGAHGSGGARGPDSSGGLSLSMAYKVLDVETSATDAEVKKAYRRLMNQHHPDKLVAKGLRDEMMQVAKEKSQEIRAAYDVVKKNRGMR